MRVTGGAKKIKALAPGASTTVSFTMSAILPAPTSQTPEDVQNATWNAEYQSRCGVDLHVDLDWAGPVAQAPVNDHKEVYLYQGFHNSKSWQENHRDLPTSASVTTSVCVPLNQVARSVYKQIGCKVVGYALFVGDKTTGSHAIYDAFGQARTSSSPAGAGLHPHHADADRQFQQGADRDHRLQGDGRQVRPAGLQILPVELGRTFAAGAEDHLPRTGIDDQRGAAVLRRRYRRPVLRQPAGLLHPADPEPGRALPLPGHAPCRDTRDGDRAGDPVRAGDSAQPDHLEQDPLLHRHQFRPDAAGDPPRDRLDDRERQRHPLGASTSSW